MPHSPEIPDQLEQQRAPVPVPLGNAVIVETGATFGANQALMLAEAVQANSDAPITYGPPGLSEYPPTPADPAGAKLNPYDRQVGEKALAYGQELFPHATLRVLSTKGSTAVVLADTEGRAYKILHSAEMWYSGTEHEAASMGRLHQLGLAPQLHLLVDAAPQYRADPPGRGPQPDFADQPIARQESTGAHPVLIMDLVQNPTHLSKVADKDLLREFDRITDIMQQADLPLFFGDTEPVYDEDKQQIVFLDTFGVGTYRPESRYTYYANSDKKIDNYPGATEEQVAWAQSVIGLFCKMHGGRRDGFDVQALEQMYIDEGLAEVKRILGHSLDVLREKETAAD